MEAELSRKYRVSAAHKLTSVSARHKCSRIHGHDFEIEVGVRGPVDEERGWVMDFAEIDEAVLPLIEQLDHCLLNEIEGLDNPTSEHLAAWLLERLSGRLPYLAWVAVSESPTSRCVVRARR